MFRSILNSNRMWTTYIWKPLCIHGFTSSKLSISFNVYLQRRTFTNPIRIIWRTEFIVYDDMMARTTTKKKCFMTIITNNIRTARDNNKAKRSYFSILVIINGRTSTNRRSLLSVYNVRVAYRIGTISTVCSQHNTDTGRYFK